MGNSVLNAQSSALTESSVLIAPPAPLRAVVFDLGGTLIDYLGGAPSWPEMEIPGVAALHRCLAKAGFFHEAEIFHENFLEAMDERWRAATEGLGDPPTLASLITEVCTAAGFHLTTELHEAAVASYWAPIAERAVVAAGAREILVWLRAHGVRTGLISNTLWPGDAHRLDLERYGLLEYVDHAVFSSEVGLWKPDPRVFNLVLQRLDAPANRAVFVGDRLAEDIDGAQRAGLRAIFVEGTQDYDDISLRGIQPDAVIEQLTELPVALAALWPNGG
jgi:putative hydrolase of the HAD superfamily